MPPTGAIASLVAKHAGDITLHIPKCIAIKSHRATDGRMSAPISFHLVVYSGMISLSVQHSPLPFHLCSPTIVLIWQIKSL